MSMANRSSGLDDQKSVVNVQTEGHTLTLPRSQNGSEGAEAFGSTPPIDHLSLWQGSNCQIAQRLGTVLKFKLP